MSTFETVVGLDLSLTSTGVASWSRRGVSTGRLKSEGHKGDSWTVRHQRLSDLVGKLSTLIPDPALVVIEAPSYGSVGGSSHDRSGCWWMVYDFLYWQGCAVLPVEPTVLKKFATGTGKADKDAVLAAVVRRYLDIDVTGNDQADAVALLDIGMHLIGKPLADLPALNRSVLDKISLPETTDV